MGRAGTIEFDVRVNEAISAELAALRATVERQGEALRRLVEALSADNGKAPGEFWPLSYGEGQMILAALDAPAPDASGDPTVGIILPAGSVITPPADAPLPGPVADAVAQMRASSGLLRSKGYTASAVALDVDADSLEAWARAQQQPALGDDVREAMREAAHHLGGLGIEFSADTGGGGMLRPDRSLYGQTLKALAARLRELAGEP